MDRPAPRGRPKLVAGAAAGTHGLRQLTVSILVVVRRQLAPDQPGLPDRGRTVAGRAIVQGHSFPEAAVDYDAVIPFKHRLLETAWSNFNAGAAPDLTPAYEQFRNEQAHWLEDYALFRALKAKYQRRPLPRVAGRAGPARPGCAGRRPGGNWRARSTRFAWHSSCCSARGNG